MNVWERYSVVLNSAIATGGPNSLAAKNCLDILMRFRDRHPEHLPDVFLLEENQIRISFVYTLFTITILCDNVGKITTKVLLGDKIIYEDITYQKSIEQVDYAGTTS